MLRGLNYDTPFPSGVYTIEPKYGRTVKTYCDFNRYDGGWTLLAKTSGEDVKWTKDEALGNSKNPLGNKYSIFGLVDELKLRDPAEVILLLFLTHSSLVFQN